MMPFTDKQIMDLSQQQTNEFVDLQNHSHDEEHASVDSISKEEIVPSYDFHPIRPIGTSLASSPPLLDGDLSLPRVWNSSDSSKANASTAPIKSYSSLDSTEPSKLIPEKDRFSLDATIISEIDKSVKKHVDNLLHVLQNFSAQLSQMESRSCHLDNSMDELKVFIGNNHGNTDGKLRNLENILAEVQSGVQVLKEKQEIVEAHLQLEKLKVGKIDQRSESHSSLHVESIQPATPAKPSYQHLPSQPMPSLPSSVALPQLPTQPNHPTSVQFPKPFPQNQIPPPTQETLNPQYQLPPNQQYHSSPAVPPHQQYQPSSQQQYSELPAQQQQHQQQQQSVPSLNPPPQLHPPVGPQAEETPYIPSQNYPHSLPQKPPQPPTGPPLIQQFYGGPSLGYESSSGRTNSGYSSGYGPPSAPGESYHYGRIPSPYSTSSPGVKPQVPSSTNSMQRGGGGGGGGGGYPQLPSTGRVLPHALPTATGISGGGSGSTGIGNGNRVPADEIVDKVASMGFSRDLAMSTIRKLTENGQSVDLNLVLDKLMNEGEVQPGRTWPFGR